MSTTREELRALMERVPADREESALRLLQHIVDLPLREPRDARPGMGEDPFRLHWRRVGERMGVDVDQLPKNGGWSGSQTGGRIEVTKDWMSEGARYRLSKFEVEGHRIIVQERIQIAGGAKLQYEVQVFSDESEGHAEVNLALGSAASRNG